jgi:hypothetical protein
LKGEGYKLPALPLLAPDDDIAEDFGVFSPYGLALRVGVLVGHSRDRGVDTGNGEAKFVGHKYFQVMVKTGNFGQV